MQKQWIKTVVTRLLSLEDPALMYAVMSRLSGRLACKIIDIMELEILQKLDRVREKL